MLLDRRRRSCCHALDEAGGISIPVFKQLRAQCADDDAALFMRIRRAEPIGGSGGNARAWQCRERSEQTRFPAPQRK